MQNMSNNKTEIILRDSRQVKNDENKNISIDYCLLQYRAC